MSHKAPSILFREVLLWPPEISVNDAIKDKSAVVASQPQWPGKARSKHSVHFSNQQRQFASFSQAPRYNDDSVGRSRKAPQCMIDHCNLKVFSSLFSTSNSNVGAARTFLRKKSSVVVLIAPTVKKVSWYQLQTCSFVSKTPCLVE